MAREEDSKFGNNKDLDFESAQSVSDHLLRGTDESWAETLSINSRGVFFASAAFLPLLEAGHKTIKGYTSSIVNITSISGIMRGPSMGQFAYAASKAAALATTRNMANSLVKTKIRVNSIVRLMIFL